MLITEDAQRTMLTHLGVSSTPLVPTTFRSRRSRSRNTQISRGSPVHGGFDPAAASAGMIELAQKHGVKVALIALDPFLDQSFPGSVLGVGSRGLSICCSAISTKPAAHSGLEDAIDVLTRFKQAFRKRRPDDERWRGPVVMHDGEVDPAGIPGQGDRYDRRRDMYAAGLLYGVTNGDDVEAGRSSGIAGGGTSRRADGRQAGSKFTRYEIDQFAK